MSLCWRGEAIKNYCMLEIFSIIRSLSVTEKSFPYIRRKSSPCDFDGLRYCFSFSSPDITNFLAESYILLTILKRSKGDLDNNIS